MAHFNISMTKHDKILRPDGVMSSENTHCNKYFRKASAKGSNVKYKSRTVDV